MRTKEDPDIHINTYISSSSESEWGNNCSLRDDPFDVVTAVLPSTLSIVARPLTEGL